MNWVATGVCDLLQFTDTKVLRCSIDFIFNFSHIEVPRHFGWLGPLLFASDFTNRWQYFKKHYQRSHCIHCCMRRFHGGDYKFLAIAQTGEFSVAPLYLHKRNKLLEILYNRVCVVLWAFKNYINRTQRGNDHSGMFSLFPWKKKKFFFWFKTLKVHKSLLRVNAHLLLEIDHSVTYLKNQRRRLVHL